MLDKIKLVGSLLIPYLFVCATCWHISYWSTFHINPFEFIGISDIIISFAYPFVYTSLVILITSILNNILFLQFVKEDKVESVLDFVTEIKVFKNTFIKGFLKAILYIFIGFYLLSVFVLTIFIKDENKVTILPIMYFFIFWVLFVRTSFYKYSESRFKQYGFTNLFIFLLLIPVFSISHSKTLALEIKNNKEYTYTTLKEGNDSTKTNYKILGKLGDYIFLSTLDNKETQIVKLDKAESFKVYYFKGVN